MTRAALRSLLREAALAYGPFGQYSATLGNRLWAAHDALNDSDSCIPDAGTLSDNCTGRDDRRDHDRHPPRVL